MITRCLSGTLILLLVAPTLHAEAVDTSLKPQRRPAAEVSRNAADLTSVPAPAHTDVRPEARPAQRVAAKPAPKPVATASAAEAAAFDAWVRDFRPRALAQGVSASPFDRAFRTAVYDPDVIARDSNQAEFTKPIWDYLASAASDSRIENGRAALARYRAVLDRIEARYGVDKEVVVAVWGMESAYGAHRGTKPVIGSLATLAHNGRRVAFFEEQLIAALKILQNGDTAPETMTGSWAGAMGHTQFIPTSYEALAVDFTGDGRRDIWSDDPTDALASTAAYLARYDWKKGQPWGVEVRLPDGFDYTSVSKSNTKMPSAWARLGVVGMDGRAVPDHGQAAVFLPAGSRGPAFLTFRNFSVIARYNNADAYVMGVGHLADRLRGAGPIRGDWPTDDRTLSFSERKELQQRLTAQGFATGGVDGRIGPRSTAAIQDFQTALGLIPDGFASLSLLERLR